MISLKDYAAKRNITYEAVRKSVARYKDELDGHIIKIDRTQFLDDEAEAFLDEKRQKNPVVIIQQDKDEQIEQLRRENEQLKDKLIAAQEALLNQKDEIARLKDENYTLLAAGAQPAAPEPESQDEVVVDAEPVDPQPAPAQPAQEEAAIDLDPAVCVPPKAGFWKRCKAAWEVLKGE